jgi:hypothetical protein
LGEPPLRLEARIGLQLAAFSTQATEENRMNEYEPFDSMDISVVRALPVMFDPDFLADLIQPFWLARHDGRVYKTNEGWPR